MQFYQKISIRRLLRLTLVLGFVYAIKHEMGMYIPNPYKGKLPSVRPAARTDDRMTAECPNLSPPCLDGYFEHWQNVVPNSRSHFVFSAYIDEATIRMIGATDRAENRSDEQLYCQLWHKYTTSEGNLEKNEIQGPVITKAERELHKEAPGKRFGSTYYKCPFPTDIIPYSVSLVTENKCNDPLNHVAVSGPSDKKYKFTVCVKAIHSNFSDVYKLVEFIELHRILGAENFAFYDTSIGSNVRKAIDMYISQGLVELVSWKMPPLSRGDIHDFALSACLNDCLYRKRHSAEYIAFVDLDEFIIPRNAKNKTWTDMLAALPEMGAYQFLNTFFVTDWPDRNVLMSSDYESVKKYHLTTLSKLDRETKVYPSGKRSKLIVKADAIDTVGNHLVWKMRKEWRSMSVSPDIAMTQHYRHWSSADIRNKSRDVTMLKYKDDLIRNVAKAFGSVNLNQEKHKKGAPILKHAPSFFRFCAT